MNELTIKTAEQEALRFLGRVKEYRERQKRDDSSSVYGTKEGGAVRRASLDLSRALSNLRKTS